MENKNLQFVHCPKCGGSGKNEKQLPCSECSGLGLGSFFLDKFLYWGGKINNSLIFLKKIERIINWVINIIAIALGASGVLALLWYLYNSIHFYKLETFFFWQHHNGYLLFFWFTVLADMFLVYRINQYKIKKNKIKRKKFGKTAISSDDLPNNWQELKTYKPKLDVSQSFSALSWKKIEEAYKVASKYGSSEVLPKHIFFSLLKTGEIKALFVRLNVNTQDLKEKIKNQIDKQTKINEKPKKTKKISLANPTKEALITAYTEAYELKQNEVKLLNILAPVIANDKDIVEVLADFEINIEQIKNVIEWFRVNDKMIAAYKRYKKMARFKPGTNMDRAYTALATPILDTFSYDLTLAAKWGRLDFCVGREKEIKSIFENIESGAHGIILVGPNGVGRRTVISGIAERMVEEDVPKIWKDKRLIELDIARLLSGADAARAQERLGAVIDEIKRAKNIILFIENIENVIGITAGEEESLELSEVLASAIDRKEIYCLGVTTDKDYAKYVEGKAIGNSMTKIKVEEPQGNEAIQIVQSKVGILENKYKIYFSYTAIEKAVKLSSKYMHDKYLPEKAIKVLESAAVDVSKRCKQYSDQCMCTKDDIAKIISDITSIPTEKVTTDESQMLLNLEEKIHKRMVNQEEAVSMVSDSLRRARTDLREGKRPIASFLFLGPTGVGKTELAKTVSEVYFGDEDYMIRIDMSEYQEASSLNKMIGDEGGSLGYLTEAVRNKPFSLILLDEFEKAHPNILNLFLQVMDDGRLTDGQGRTIDFTNAIIIATSNAGSLFIQEQIRKNAQISTIKEALIQEHLNKIMRPELINRFDGIVVFTPLSEEHVMQIAKLMLGKTEKMLNKQGINLEINDSGLKKLAHEGYDPKFGARPLRRLLQDKIENVIANKILTKELDRRDTVIINDRAEVEVRQGREL